MGRYASVITDQFLNSWWNLADCRIKSCVVIITEGAEHVIFCCLISGSALWTGKDGGRGEKEETTLEREWGYAAYRARPPWVCLTTFAFHYVLVFWFFTDDVRMQHTLQSENKLQLMHWLQITGPSGLLTSFVQVCTKRTARPPPFSPSTVLLCWGQHNRSDGANSVDLIWDPSSPSCRFVYKP